LCGACQVVSKAGRHLLRRSSTAHQIGIISYIRSMPAALSVLDVIAEPTRRRI
jgi:hypothetical protein